MNGPYTPWWPGPGPYGPYPQQGVVYVPMPASKEVAQKGVMEQLQEIEQQIDGLKRIKTYLKEEEKKDKDDDKKKKKDEINWEKFFQYAGILAVGSFPMIWVQMKFFEWASTALHGLH